MGAIQNVHYYVLTERAASSRHVLIEKSFTR
jgi:hypothetical protein